jgi:arylsulfatase A-like enzyme
MVRRDAGSCWAPDGAVASMPRWFRVLALAAATPVGAAVTNRTVGAQTRPPNIVVIVADDLGYGDIGVQGGRDISTPHIDALAAGGVRFTDAYVSNPFCSPTRAGLLTGKYPQRFGYEFNLVDQYTHDFGLPVEEPTLADRLQSVGYKTALIGKWHLGSSSQFHPLVRGFDEFFGFLGGAHSYMELAAGSRDPIVDGRTPVREMKYLTDALTDRAVDFIARNKARPFFLYLSFNAVHEPLQAPDKYLARFPGIADPQRRLYAAMLAAMDDGVGRTIAALREQGLEQETLIFFFSDNGGPTTTGGVNGSSNAPLRGSKREMYEGGIRVPFIVQWKGRLPAGRVDNRPIIQLDVFPTALAAAGVPIAPAWKLDGVDLLPYLGGERIESPHEALYWRLGAMMAVRVGDWKLVRMHEGQLRTDSITARDLASAELYNLTTDIGEQRDLATGNSARVRELAAAWSTWNAALVKPRFGPPRAGRPP